MLPCMEGFLPSVYLHHVALLVAAVYYLNQRSIQPEDIQRGSELLEKFHADFIVLYGTIRLCGIVYGS